MAGNLGCGLEEAGRQARRNAYGDCVRRLGGARIALATIRMIWRRRCCFTCPGELPWKGWRPCGRSGAGDPSPAVCQPKEIEEELRRRGLSWRTDSSNLTDDYIQKLYPPSGDSGSGGKGQPESRGAYSRGGGGFSGGGRIPSAEAEKRRERLTSQEGNSCLLVQGLEEEPSLLAGMVILASLESISGSRKDISREHLEAVRQLFGRPRENGSLCPGVLPRSEPARGEALCGLL